MQVCYQVNTDENLWILDSGCSHHMTGNKNLFMNINYTNKGSVTLGDNSSCKIIGIGSIGNGNDVILNKVMLVKGLKHNLISISQLCDKNNRIIFENLACYVQSVLDNKILFTGVRKGNIYLVNFHKIDNSSELCLHSVKGEDQFLWHRKLGHISISVLSKLSRKNLVRGLPKLDSKKEFFCDACVKGKHTRSSFKSKNNISSSRTLELIHMDLFGPANIMTLGGKYFCFVLVDDFSRYCWIYLLRTKDETLSKLKSFTKLIQNELDDKIKSIRSDNGGEFTSDEFKNFCDENGITHYYSAPRTPQQNGVAERKNRTLIEIARTLLNDFNLPKNFWGEAVSTACYVTNRALIRSSLKKTPYELLKGRKPNIGYFHPFGCKCFILNSKDNLGKFDAKSDEGVFLGYSSHSKAFRVYNKRTFKVEESINVVFDESICENEPQDVDEDEVLFQEDSAEYINEKHNASSEEGSSEPNKLLPSSDVLTENSEQQIMAPQHIVKRHPPSQGNEANTSKVEYALLSTTETEQRIESTLPSINRSRTKIKQIMLTQLISISRARRSNQGYLIATATSKKTLKKGASSFKKYHQIHKV
ncbi:Retrovirus-related Pol polyprotein from transposon TNT 1-94 [Linum perenne]